MHSQHSLTTEILSLQTQTAQLSTQNSILASQKADLAAQISDLTLSLKASEVKHGYFKKELATARDEYKELIRILGKTQEELALNKEPSLAHDHPCAIEIRKLKLKIEGLGLINEKLTQSVADSKRVLKQVELV